MSHASPPAPINRQHFLFGIEAQVPQIPGVMALTAKETALFKDAFVLFDRDARGAVTAADLQVVWSSMGRNFAAGEIEGARCRWWHCGARLLGFTAPLPNHMCVCVLRSELLRGQPSSAASEVHRQHKLPPQSSHLISVVDRARPPPPP